jgi:hypothetical protein
MSPVITIGFRRQIPQRQAIGSADTVRTSFTTVTPADWAPYSHHDVDRIPTSQRSNSLGGAGLVVGSMVHMIVCMARWSVTVSDAKWETTNSHWYFVLLLIVHEHGSTETHTFGWRLAYELHQGISRGMDQLNAVCAVLRLFVPGFGIAFFFRTDGTGRWPTDDSTHADSLTELIVGKRCVVSAEAVSQIRESLIKLALAHHEKMGEHLSQCGGWDPGWVSRGNQPWIGLPKGTSVHKGDDPNKCPVCLLEPDTVKVSG